MKFTHFLKQTGWIVLLTLCLAACNLNMGKSEHNGKNSSEASFALMTNTSTRQIDIQEADKALMVAYEVELSKGSIAVRLFDPAGALAWEKTFSATATEKNCIAIDQLSTGKWALEITADKAGGHYKVQWDTTCPAE